jgi:hypothetical protein
VEICVAASVGEADAGSAQGVPELQTDAMGSAKPVGQGFVYVLKTTDGRLAKIGYSTNVEKRVKDLRTKASVMLLTDLEVVTTCPGTYELEKLLHRRFNRFRHRGDWYSARVLKPLMALPWPPTVELLSPAEGCSSKPPKGSKVTHAQYIHLTKIARLGGAARTQKLTAEQQRAAALKSWVTRRSGGKISKPPLTAEQRSEIARKAASPWSREGERRSDTMTKAQRKCERLRSAAVATIGVDLEVTKQ